jgi:hypothetical protein
MSPSLWFVFPGLKSIIHDSLSLCYWKYRSYFSLPHLGDPCRCGQFPLLFDDFLPMEPMEPMEGFRNRPPSAKIASP